MGKKWENNLDEMEEWRIFIFKKCQCEVLSEKEVLRLEESSQTLVLKGTKGVQK